MKIHDISSKTLSFFLPMSKMACCLIIVCPFLIMGENPVPEIIQLLPHSGAIYAVAFSPDGSIFATGGSDRRIILWSSKIHNPVYVLNGHRGTVRALVFSSDGKKIASGSDDSTIKIWSLDMKTVDSDSGKGRIKSLETTSDEDTDNVDWIDFPSNGTCLISAKYDTTLTGYDEVNAVALSSDGTLLASASSDSTIRFWSMETYKELNSISLSGAVTSIDFSPNGKTIVAGSMKYVSVFKRSENFHIDCSDTLSRHPDQYISVRVSPDGKQIAIGSSGATVKLWDKRKDIRILPGQISKVFCLDYSPDGQFLAAGEKDGVIQIWNVKEEVQYGLYRDDKDRSPIVCLAISPDNDIIVSGSTGGTLHFWNAPRLPDRGGKKGCPSVVLSLSCTNASDPPLLAFCDGGDDICVWSLRSGELLTSVSNGGPCNAISFLPGGDTLATVCGKEVKKFAVKDTTKPEVQFTINKNRRGHTKRSLAVSPASVLIATIESDNSIKIYSSIDGKRIATLKTAKRVECISFSPRDSDIFVSGDSTGEVTVWSIYREKSLHTLRDTGHAGTVTSLVFSPDGSVLAAGSVESIINIWNASDFTYRRTLYGHGGSVSALCFTSNGDALISGSDDSTIILWRPQNEFKQFRRFRGMQSAVTTLKFVDSTRIVISGGSNRDLYFWCIDEDRWFLKAYSFTEGNYFTYTPEGYFIASDRVRNHLEEFIIVKGLNALHCSREKVSEALEKYLPR